MDFKNIYVHRMWTNLDIICPNKYVILYKIYIWVAFENLECYMNSIFISKFSF